jgi:DHA2 family multidrug resistance protein
MTTAAAQARYPLTQGVNPWLVTVSVMLPTFMEVLDTAIASVALPYIAGSLSASNSEATWVLTSYLVANAVILPASNWFARRFGRKRFLLICVIIFTVASFFCGAAPSLAVILLARVLQGAGGGALQPLSQSILLESFPVEKRSMAMAAYGLGIVVAPVLGPTLGGWLTDTFSWRYAFYINIPVGILAVFMISRFVHDPPYIKNAKVGPSTTSASACSWSGPAPADRARQGPGRRLVWRAVGALGCGRAGLRAHRLDLALVDPSQRPGRSAHP